MKSIGVGEWGVGRDGGRRERDRPERHTVQEDWHYQVFHLNKLWEVREPHSLLELSLKF
jgi:hypothetical protein